MYSKLFETALCISDPWFVNDINFVSDSTWPSRRQQRSTPKWCPSFQRS
ncbi:MAG: hypothetical protein VB142_09800 [Burkholderia sp.]